MRPFSQTLRPWIAPSLPSVYSVNSSPLTLYSSAGTVNLRLRQLPRYKRLSGAGQPETVLFAERRLEGSSLTRGENQPFLMTSNRKQGADVNTATKILQLATISKPCKANKTPGISLGLCFCFVFFNLGPFGPLGPLQEREG